jgi:NAD(P)-dependent dehydrogenase (short-subunit alcohol dehydrogenase family)
MSNPVVLITGALTGIGRAAAVAFAKKGAKVVVAGRRDEAGKALVEELRAFGTEADARRMTSEPWSIRPSHGLAVSMSR